MNVHPPAPSEEVDIYEMANLSLGLTKLG